MKSTKNSITRLSNLLSTFIKINTPILILSLFFLLASCDKDSDTLNNNSTVLKETKVDLVTHKLAAYSIIKNSEYLVVFESGLGDSHAVWNGKNIPVKLHTKSDVLTYDRASYGKSEKGPDSRNIGQLRSELERIITHFSNGRKVILIGHSLGGMIIRDYAVKNPDQVAGLLFIDPSHEHYNQPSQADEDMIYSLFNTSYGSNFGGTLESRELIEDSQYMATLPQLPNIPVIVISSLKVDSSHSVSDRQLWYEAHELLKNGITDFTHITTTTSGHYIMDDEPNLVIENFDVLLSKLP